MPTMIEFMKVRYSFMELCVEEIADKEWTSERLGSFFAKKIYCKSENVVVRFLKRSLFFLFTKKFLQRQHYKLFGEKKEIKSVSLYYKDLMKKLLIPEDAENKRKMALSEIDYRQDLIKREQDALDANYQTYATSKSDRQKKAEYYKKRLDASYEKAQKNKDVEKKILMNALEYSLFKPSIDTTGLDIPHFRDEEDVVLMSKFEEMSFHDYATIRNEYKREGEQTEKFKKITRSYIVNNKIYEKCLNIIIGNTFIWKKCQKNLLCKVLGYYNYDSYAFSLTVAPNIEGLFSKYCSDCDIGEAEILNNAVSEKARKLSEKGLIYKHEVIYYTYFFPIVRNRLMHGEKLGSDWENRADLLLLDFYRALRVAESSSLHFNVISNVLYALKTSYSYADMLKFCAIYESIEKNESDVIIKKYKELFINDIIDRIKKKRKIPYCCRVVALMMDNGTDRERRALIFQHIEKNVDAWYLCCNVDGLIQAGLY